MAPDELTRELEGDRKALRRARKLALRERRMRAGALVVPSLFTFANMLLGFAAILVAQRGAFSLAAGLILLAAVCDSLDGRLARMLGATTKFGVELDSLSDLVSFCLAPAFILHAWRLHELGRVGAAVGGFFLVAGAGRLARFNVVSVAMSNRYILGLTTTMSGVALMALLYAAESEGWSLPATPLALVVIAFAALMVTTLPYRTFKDTNFARFHPLVWLMALAGLALVLVWQPEIGLLSLIALYVAGAPVAALHRLLTGRPSPLAPAGPPADATAAGGGES